MKIEATLLGEQSRTFKLGGRVGQTLSNLYRAGPQGITSLEAPALRLAAHVHALRKLGFTITTEREPHGGDYPGHHARYQLACDIVLTTANGEGMQ